LARKQEEKQLPVDPERLKAEFPDLSDEDLEAFVEVTKQVLADPASKGRIMRQIMTTALEAREKAAAGGSLSAQDALALRYLAAVGKMQRSTVHKPN
jgi:TPR repeat protein